MGPGGPGGGPPGPGGPGWGPPGPGPFPGPGGPGWGPPGPGPFPGPGGPGPLPGPGGFFCASMPCAVAGCYKTVLVVPLVLRAHLVLPAHLVGHQGRLPSDSVILVLQYMYVYMWVCVDALL
ncbi:hypothetical protein HHK36_026583 [Tetracentron sinense]|uniref:Uncharacterized protein n=1 Tax=Tetracentron sinense TaxID=13715 RepID=A0A834YLL8_TETSI|nr:hypothetical protein HHK36_026583 [Tetracentron sinense]